MAGSQWIHVNSYSSSRPLARTRSGKVTGKTKFSAADILAEVDRDPAACQHVAEPRPPNWLLGSRAGIESAGKAWLVKLGVDGLPDDARGDSAWLAAGVVSLPAARLAEWPKFRDATIKQLEKKYGKNLLGVVEHLDEPNPHLHFYAVPMPGESFGLVHEGWGAKSLARRSGIRRVGAAFTLAMRNLQNEFYEAIGKPFGLTRFGPKRDRLTRAEWRIEQAEAMAQAAEADVVDAKADARDLIKKAKVDADKLLAKAAKTKATVEVESAARIVKAEADAKVKADSIIKVARIGAVAVVAAEVEKETARIRQKGANYFVSARSDIRRERAAAREESRAESARIEAVLKNNTVLRDLADMRGRIKNAEIAIKAGKISEAEEHLRVAKARDFVPQFKHHAIKSTDFDI